MLTQLRRWLDPPSYSYGLALALGALAVLARHLAGAGLPTGLLLLACAPAVTIVAAVGGTGPAWLVTVLAALAVSVSWTPYPSVGALGLDGLVGLGLFAVNGVLVGSLTGEGRRAAREAEARVDGLEHEVESHRLAEKRLERLTSRLELRVAEQEQRLAEEHTARAEADGRAREAQLLSELALTANDAPDVEQMLRPIARVSRALCASEVARVALRRPGSGVMAVRHQTGALPEGPEPAALDPALAHTVATTGRPLRVARAAGDRDRATTDAPEEGGAVATLIVPIRIGERVEGLLCVDNVTGRPFTDRDERALLGVAAHAAVAIRNAQRLAGEHDARAAAEDASRAKDEFLAMLGHELRNPLGAIGNAVHAFHRLGDQATRLQGIIGRQTQHLARILDDLLDVARLASGKITLVRQPVDLKEVAERAVAALGQEGKTARHDIVLPEEPVLVEGDPTRLEQVLRNLVDNAVKYTPEGGRIAITAVRAAGQAELRVTDTGIGIPPEVLPRIFERFFQDDRATGGSAGGFGLGLSLVKRLVEAHGGVVSAASEGPGRGSEFLVRLPLLAEVPAGAEPVVSAPSPVTPRRVLIIEDNADVRDGLRLFLEGLGHRVSAAEDGMRGLELMAASRPEIALIDVGLPGLDGFAVARAIRQAPGGGDVLLVALTGYGRAEDRRRAEEAGFARYLLKPVDEADLLSVLTIPAPAAGAGSGPAEEGPPAAQMAS